MAATALARVYTRLGARHLHGPERVDQNGNGLTVRFECHHGGKLRTLELELDDHNMRRMAELIHQHLAYRQAELDRTMKILKEGKQP